MKRIILFSIYLLITGNLIIAQETGNYRIPLIGESAPSFTAQSTTGQIVFPDDYYSKWKILLSHPADFTPVCTSELLSLANMQKDFKKLNTSIVVLSTDGLNSHIEWVKSMESLEYNDKKIVKIEFPIVSDENLEISKKYGMLHPYSSTTKDIRAVFIIDPDDKIQALFYYPNSVGRNLEEIKRTLIALQTSEKHKLLIPANWSYGDDLMIPSPSSIKEAEKLESKNDPDIYSLAWYMWFKKMK